MKLSATTSASGVARRRWRSLLLGTVTAAAVAMGAAESAHAQYTMVQYVAIGGGATQSTGGSYTLASTIGQIDPGVLEAGIHAIKGGFLRGGAPVTGVEDEKDVALPRGFQLRPAFPNPFLHQAMLGFDLPTSRHVRMRVYDASGRLTRTLVEGRMPPGRHSRVWDGLDDHGARVATGIYFIRLEAESDRAMTKVAVLR